MLDPNGINSKGRLGQMAFFSEDLGCLPEGTETFIHGEQSRKTASASAEAGAGGVRGSESHRDNRSCREAETLRQEKKLR